MKRLGEFLLAKDANAIIVAFICALLPLVQIPTGFVAAIIVGLVTLCKGAKQGLLVLAWVALPAIAMLVLKRFGPFDIFLLRCVLTWFFAALLRKYSAWGLVLEIGTVVAIAAVLILHFTFPQIHHWWVTQLSNFMNEMAASPQLKGDISLSELAGRMAPIATGLLAFVFVGGTILQLAVARWWEYLLRSPGVFAKEFSHIRVGSFLSGLTVALFLMAAFKIPAVVDVVPIVILPFFIGGISFLQWVMLGKPKAVLVMLVVYIGIILLPIFVICALAIVGFFDSWFDFRKRVVRS